jgi:hypothetical protein
MYLMLMQQQFNLTKEQEQVQVQELFGELLKIVLL